jgi:hypothetical protein
MYAHYLNKHRKRLLLMYLKKKENMPGNAAMKHEP